MASRMTNRRAPPRPAGTTNRSGIPAHRRPTDAGQPRSVVHPSDRFALAAHPWISQKLGPTGSGKSDSALNVPSSSRRSGVRQWSGRRAGGWDRAAERVEGRLVAWAVSSLDARDRAPPGSRHACRPSSTPRSIRFPVGRRSRELQSHGVDPRRTVCESAAPTAPSGNTVTMDPISIDAAVTTRPSPSTRRKPRRHAVWNRLRPGAGPSDRTGSASAAARLGAPHQQADQDGAPCNAALGGEVLTRASRAASRLPSRGRIHPRGYGHQSVGPDDQTQADAAKEQGDQDAFQLCLPANDVEANEGQAGKHRRAECPSHDAHGPSLTPPPARGSADDAFVTASAWATSAGSSDWSFTCVAPPHCRSSGR